MIFFRNLQLEYNCLRKAQDEVTTGTVSSFDRGTSALERGAASSSSCELLDVGAASADVAASSVSLPAREAEMLAEAKMLRQHKGRLEARMQILEDHNKQLEAQLLRLRQLLDQVSIFTHH